MTKEYAKKLIHESEMKRVFIKDKLREVITEIDKIVNTPSGDIASELLNIKYTLEDILDNH